MAREQSRKFTISSDPEPVNWCLDRKQLGPGKWVVLTEITLSKLAQITPQIVRLIIIFLRKAFCLEALSKKAYWSGGRSVILQKNIKWATFTYFIVCKWWFKGDLRWSCIILLRIDLSLFWTQFKYISSVLDYVLFGYTDHWYGFYITSCSLFMIKIFTNRERS